MMIAPPLAGKATPLDALLSKTQPRDTESPQPVSFDEVLKDEEKKLKQEQEAAMLIAAVPLQTVALPTAPETLPPADGESAPEGGQGVQPAALRGLGVQLGGLDSVHAIESLEKQNRAPVQFSPVSAPAGTAQSTPVPQLKPAPVGQSIPLNTESQAAPVQPMASFTADSSETAPAETKTQVIAPQAEQVEVVTSKQEVPVKEAQSQSVIAPEMKTQIITPQTEHVEVVTPKQEVPVKEAQSQPVTAPDIRPAEMNAQVESLQTEQAEIVTPEQYVSVKEAQSQSVAAPEIKSAEIKAQVIASQSEQTEVVKSKQEIPVKEAQLQPIQNLESDTAINPDPVKKSVVAAQYSALQFENAAVQSPMTVAENGLFTANAVAPESIDAPQNATSQLTDPSVVIQSIMRDTASTVKDSASFIQNFQPAVQPSEVIGQIMGQMKVRIKSGLGTMRLQLNPQELGAIEVQVVRNDQGISVTFSAEQPGTGRILEAQADQLRQALKDAGVQLNGLNISQQDHHPRQEGGSLKQSPYFGPYAAQDQSSAEKTSVEINRPARRIGSAGEIDYLI